MEALHTHKNQFGFCPNGPDFQHFLKYGVKNENYIFWGLFRAKQIGWEHGKKLPKGL